MNLTRPGGSLSPIHKDQRPESRSLDPARLILQPLTMADNNPTRTCSTAPAFALCIYAQIRMIKGSSETALELHSDAYPIDAMGNTPVTQQSSSNAEWMIDVGLGS